MPHSESERSRGRFAFQGTDFHIQGHGRERESRGQHIKRLEKRKRKQKGGERWWEREKGGAPSFLHSGKERRECEGGGGGGGGSLCFENQRSRLEKCRLCCTSEGKRTACNLPASLKLLFYPQQSSVSLYLSVCRCVCARVRVRTCVAEGETERDNKVLRRSAGMDHPDGRF